MTGYRHPLYVESLREFGSPRLLPASGGRLLVRSIPDSDAYDAMGPYPLFFCDDWAALREDFHSVASDLVSVALVTDPFGHYDEALLRSQFDRVIHFKDHHIADLSQPIEAIVKPSHRDTVRRALKKVSVRVHDNPPAMLDAWVDLFANLTQKHAIRGIKAFSRDAFAAQLRIPGMVMFEATHEGETVGLDLWYVQGDVAYGHLAAFSELGYQLRASYATKWTLLHHFKDKVRWVDFGAAAGTQSGVDSGLSNFKQGWSTHARPVFFCGKVLRPDVYERFTDATGTRGSTYFPAYRTGEFA